MDRLPVAVARCCRRRSKVDGASSIGESESLRPWRHKAALKKATARNAACITPTTPNILISIFDFSPAPDLALVKKTSFLFAKWFDQNRVISHHGVWLRSSPLRLQVRCSSLSLPCYSNPITVPMATSSKSSTLSKPSSEARARLESKAKISWC